MIAGKDRLIVFFTGVVIRIVVVGMIQKRRLEADPSGDSMVKKIFRDTLESTGIQPLPEGTPIELKQSRLFVLRQHSQPPAKKPRSQGSRNAGGRWPWIRVEAVTDPQARCASSSVSGCR